MNPSPDLASLELEKENERLRQIKKMLSENEMQAIIERSKSLAKLQAEDSDEKIALLPKISLADVPKKSRTLPLTHIQAGSLDLFYHTAFTNNITYADLIFPIPDTKVEDLWLIRLFSLLLTQMGSGFRSYEETLEYIQENTGGVGAYLSLYHQVHDAHAFSPTLHIKGKAMYPKAPKLFSLLFDIATSPNLTDRARIKELILKHYSNLHSSFNNNALNYASSLSGSVINNSGKLHYAWYGLEYYHKIKKLAKNIDSELDGLIVRLQLMQKNLLCTSGAHLVLTTDQTELSKYIEDGFQGLQELPQQPFHPWKNHFAPKSLGPQGRIISSPVAFTSKVCKSIPYAHPDAPALALASNLFESLTLHTKVREQGGAYGAGTVASPMSGVFSFYSYRDPNIVSTLQAFEEAIEAVIAGDFDENNLEEAKLELAQNFDTPIAPGSRGDVAYSWWREGKTEEMRQAYRDASLHATKADIMKAVETHILASYKEGVVASFAAKELLERENTRLRELSKLTFQIESP